MVYDYLIIGTGVAGLSAANNIPKNKTALIVCKKSPWEANTFYAQGGIATAVDREDIASHVHDTLEAGCYLNNVAAVQKLSEQSLEVMEKLLHDGLNVDRRSDGRIAFTKEAAHSKARIVHADGDATGRELHMFLLEHCKHEILVDAIVLDLFIQDNLCYGAQVCIEGKSRIIYAQNTIIASGGVGSIYKYHTNSVTVAGDIHGICVEKSIDLADMEMMQFHPTVFLQTSWARKTLLTEALRGEGAYIVDDENRRFLFDYHEDGELAPRDIVSRAIFDYTIKNETQAYLALEMFEKKFFQNRFPNIYKTFQDLGYELPFEKVPISPAFHYSMGGIRTDLDAKVPGFLNLYAVGEVACCGVHGANRLASNSLLEGLVFGKIAALDAQKNTHCIDPKKYTQQIVDFETVKPKDKAIKNELRNIMWHKVGIVRIKQDLYDALDEINLFLQEDVGRLLYLRLLTSKAIIEACLKRTQSVGAHFIKGN